MEIFVLSNGQRLGPFSAGDLSKAVREGRITLGDLGWLPGYEHWAPLSQMPEVLNAILPPLPDAASTTPPPRSPLPKQANSTSGNGLVKQPKQLRNWLAIFGLVLVVIVVCVFLSTSSRAKARGKAITCVLSMKQLAYASRMWAMDNGDLFPFNVPVNDGGTKELCAPAADGFDKSSYAHLEVLSNILSTTTAVLVCPADSQKQRAVDWQHIQPVNVSYLIHSGSNVDFSHPQEILAICPIHGHVLRCDGSIAFGPHFHNLAADPKCRLYAAPILPPPHSAAQ